MKKKNDFISYLIKTLVYFSVLFIISLFSVYFNIFFVIITCLILCIPNAFTLMYLVVLRKTSRARRFTEGGWHAFFNRGKIISFTVAFLFSFISAFIMFIEIPTWDLFEWIFIIAVIPVYYLIYKFAKSFLEKEFKGYYAESPKIIWCSVLVPVIMCIAYFTINYHFIPAVEYQSIEEAFIAHENILQNSSSAVVRDTVKLTSMFDALYYYIIGKASASISWINIFGKLIIYAVIFINITNILHFFMIPRNQMKRIILPLTTEAVPAHRTPVQKRYVFYMIFLVLCISAFSLGFDYCIEQLNSRGYFTKIEKFVREKIVITVAIIEGVPYQYDRVKDLMNGLKLDSELLKKEVSQEMIPLINQSMDLRIANVDLYLDSYYSMTADYLRLFNLVKGTIETHLEEQLKEKLSIGINDAELENKLSKYLFQTEQLIEKYMHELEKYEINPKIPAWMLDIKSLMDISDFLEPVKPAKQFLDYRVRFGISGAVGLSAGIVTRQVVVKLVTKQLFQKMAARLAVVAGGKVASAAAGAKGGALIGSAGGPIGTVAGAIVGATAGIGTHYLLLSADEALNRESFRNEIIEAIENQRQELLGLFL